MFKKIGFLQRLSRQDFIFTIFFLLFLLLFLIQHRTMENEFLTKAKENITAAALLFENELYNASANRAYYAAFQAAIAAISEYWHRIP
jgi:hypothetical protein